MVTITVLKWRMIQFYVRSSHPEVYHESYSMYVSQGLNLIKPFIYTCRLKTEKIQELEQHHELKEMQEVSSPRPSHTVAKYRMYIPLSLFPRPCILQVIKT